REIGMALSDACEEESIPYPQTPNERPEILFLELIRPLIARALHKFRNGAQPLSQSQASLGSTPEGVERLCVSLLPGRLLAVLARTMALELNVARVQGLLLGDTGEERFASFISRIRQPQVRLEFFLEYPVLVRMLANILETWAASSVEFLQRWCAD